MKHKTLIRQFATRTLLIVTVLATTWTTAHSQTLSAAWTNVWKMPVLQGYDFLLTNGAGAALNNVRGVCINPANGNVIYATRDGGSNHLTVVDGATGVVLTRLSGSGVTGGGISLSQVRAAADGVIYAANVAAPTAGGASALKIYRWGSDTDTAAPLVVFSNLVPNLASGGTRYGDVMDLRGSGTSTEIIMSGIGGTNLALFTTADGTNFNAQLDEFNVITNYVLKKISLPAGFTASVNVGRTMCFDGANNAVIGRNTAPPSTLTHYVTYDPVTLTATNAGSFSLESRFTGFDVTTTNGLKVLMGVAYGSSAAQNSSEHQARLVDITATNAIQISASEPMPGPFIANGNAIGAADIYGNKVAILEPGGGLVLMTLFVVTNPPPSITVQPSGNTNILTGGFYTLSVGASGSGLKYQWRLNTNPISTATNASLTLTNISIAQAGNYSVVITNAGGTVTSSNADVGLLPSVLTTESAKLWQVNAGTRTYLTTDNTQRGMAYHALSNQVLVVSRAGIPSINQVNASTGANITNLNMTGVGPQVGEQFTISAAGVAEDGAIYVCNLANITSGGFFTIYRWADADPATVATIAYGPDNPAGARIGDTFAVQGSGVNTKLIASTRSGTIVVVFTTVDGLTFTANTVDVGLAPTPAPAGFAGLGLSAGSGDSFWATASGFQLRKVVYDIANGTNDVIVSVGGQTGNNIAADDANGFVASIGTADVPANLRILDVSNPAANAVLVDQEFFGSDNDNGNGTGAVAFDVAGGRVFALDSNNGLIALKYAPRVKQNGNVLTWTGPGVLQSATVVTGTYNDIVGSTSPLTTNVTGAVFFKVRR